VADLHVPPNKIHWLSDVMEFTGWDAGAARGNEQELHMHTAPEGKRARPVGGPERTVRGERIFPVCSPCSATICRRASRCAHRCKP
jgi:hypothetical protein